MVCPGSLVEEVIKTAHEREEIEVCACLARAESYTGYTVVLSNSGPLFRLVITRHLGDTHPKPFPRVTYPEPEPEPVTSATLDPEPDPAPPP